MYTSAAGNVFRNNTLSYTVGLHILPALILLACNLDYLSSFIELNSLCDLVCANAKG
jgi:hypothetical protein